RAFYNYANGESQSRLLRGITVAPDNFTLARQDIPLNIFQFSHSLQLDFVHRLSRNSFTNDFSFGGDFRRQSQGQDQVVLSLPAIDTRNPNLSIDDTALIPLANLPAFTLSNRTKSESASYFVQN